MTVAQQILKDIKENNLKPEDHYISLENEQILKSFRAGGEYESLCRRGFKTEGVNSIEYLLLQYDGDKK